ncbi:histidinol-phosphate transaminase [Pseudoduganella ginsengisoli]|uniref:Histidinol-phosphate aminotransferase n=1 Tax=Pseudoduganella ginsengisoli TaxID=1462440 RepID=A0A6L6QA42_9BURK|nr:histidinol-phosphate transaminase [Pseudoduganella ginsengisoli]MTW06112.1 histidinol-phosphate transaminase [Pseudoduganella ginsengisoli]
MSKLWSPRVKDLKPYVPGEQPRITNLTKLNTNENPYGPSPAVLAAMREETSDKLRLYPDPDATRLKEAIAAYYKVTPAEVFTGNGSDEVLAHAFQAFFCQDLPLLMPDLTYSFYPVYCGLYGIQYETVPLSDTKGIVATSYDRPCGGIVFANPNAPTGLPLALSEVEHIVRSHPDCVVLVDEAYVDFGGETSIPLTQKYPNVLVVHTFSKSRSLAGLRVGYAIGHPDLIAGLERVKNSFNSYPLSRVAIAGATASLQDEAYFQEKRAQLMASRERLAAQLQALGFDVTPSATNFLFVQHPQMAAGKLAAALRERAILVRHLSQPGAQHHLRISIGTHDECELLAAALKEILSSAAE